jgi:broad specificity phosphatase PhoE
MRALVHLRHAERQPGGPHLTQRGAARASVVGRHLGRFDRVLTSPQRRAIETAEAMGYVVDGELTELGGLPGELERWVDRTGPTTYADYLAFVEKVAEARSHAVALADRWRSEVDRLADGGRLLLVSHRGVIELGAVGAIGAMAAGWGRVPGYLEGVQLELASSGWESGVPVRPVP